MAATLTRLEGVPVPQTPEGLQALDLTYRPGGVNEMADFAGLSLIDGLLYAVTDPDVLPFATDEAVAAQWALVRADRDLRLTGSDWIMNPPADLPASVQADIVTHQAEWESYRQALRDVTEQANPFLIQWPAAPPLPTLPSSELRAVRG